MSSLPPPLPSSTANWHWKNKNVTKWGHEWFKTELLTLRYTSDEKAVLPEGAEGEKLVEVWVTDVIDIDGDIELGQRKSKLITIFDCRLTVNWTGTAADGSEVKGRIDIPEVSHENTVDDQEPYQYQFSLNSVTTPASSALYSLAKTRLPPLLDSVFRKFPVTMLDVHGKDLKVDGADTPQRSSTSTPAPAATTAAAPAPVKKEEKPKAKMNTATVTSEATFAASAADLFGLLTDEKRIPMWTRAPAVSSAQPGSPYSLFGGGVKGTYVSVTAPTEIVQTWALANPTWPADHTATLTITLNQGSDSTKVIFNLVGVPLGMQDEIKRNLEGYYIHGFKSIGLGTVL